MTHKDGQALRAGRESYPTAIVDVRHCFIQKFASADGSRCADCSDNWHSFELARDSEPRLGASSFHFFSHSTYYRFVVSA
jgi:hypothetical protein